MKEIQEYFEELETNEEYSGYYYSVQEAVTIVILGSICGLKNVSQIHQWAENERVQEFLKEQFQIRQIPCYYWLLCLLKLIKTESLNRCFQKWVRDMVGEEMQEYTLSLDGKTVRSTEKMQKYTSPLHIVSAQIAEIGLTFAQKSVAAKSNEIPAVQELLKELELGGCLVVADALNGQKKTAKAVIDANGDYLLSIKGNQQEMQKGIEEYVGDDDLRQAMSCAVTTEKNRERYEKRTAYVTDDIAWFQESGKWEKLSCIGAIHTEFEKDGKKSSEWHYYISSRKLSAEELLHHARMEWTVETMHWMLDVHFEEDFCRIEDVTVQKNLNILRKAAMNLLKSYKLRTNSKRPVSKMMFDFLLDPQKLLVLFL